MKFMIEQIALCPADSREARSLLSALGLNEWTLDHVTASGAVFCVPVDSNEADLSFNYQAGSDGKLELEILDYTHGQNWMRAHPLSVSHLGMHVTAEELVQWREKFTALGIGVAQEVVTNAHTNPAIKDSRRYNYVIFDTRDILGVDLKFIVRLPVDA